MPSNTFYNTPGAVEEFLSWTGGLGEGNRGAPPSSSNPAGIEITGEKEVLQNLGMLMQKVPEAVKGELEEWAEKILSESRKEVPWETTHLLQTGTVEPAEDDPENAIQIGYNTPYAARQHEDMTFYHPKPGRKAKYLEDPAMRIAPQIVPGICNYLNGILAGGIPSMTGMSRASRSKLGNLGGRFV